MSIRAAHEVSGTARRLLRARLGLSNRTKLNHASTLHRTNRSLRRAGPARELTRGRGAVAHHGAGGSEPATGAGRPAARATLSQAARRPAGATADRTGQAIP